MSAHDHVRSWRQERDGEAEAASVTHEVRQGVRLAASSSYLHVYKGSYKIYVLINDVTACVIISNYIYMLYMNDIWYIYII